MRLAQLVPAVIATLLSGGSLMAAIPEAPAPKERIPHLPEATPDAKTVAAASNAFACDLYAALQTHNDSGNLFYSPYSIAAALAMVQEGATGKTSDEIAKALHFDDRTIRYVDPARSKDGLQSIRELSPSGIRAGYDSLLTRLHADPDQSGFSLAVANRLWPQKDFDIKPDYLKVTTTAYHAGVQPLDFSNAAASAKTINDWVEEQTNQRIKDLVPASALSARTRLVLTNAIYFKGDWTTPFKETATTTGDFATPDKKVQTKLMHMTARASFTDFPAKDAAKNPAFQALDLPYSAGDLSMLILLPNSPADLPKLEAALTPDLLSSVISQLQKPEVHITLPRFKLEDSFNLNAALQSVGIKTAFTDSADFSNISTREGLQISDVLHKSFVEVNEKGTEAAAATAVIMKTAAIMPSQRPITFTADHPFLFLIRDRGTNAILFLGRLTDPTK
jgi:serpin B